MIVGRRQIERNLGRVWPLAAGVRGSAIFSECGNYRPYLSRHWGDGNMVMWLCMNPSSATDQVDDATSRKLTRHSRSLGYGGLFLLNVMDYCATDPGHLPEARERSVRNPYYIHRCSVYSEILIVAYGRLRNKLSWRHYADEALEACGNIEKFCVSLNKDRSPKHPRRFPSRIELQPFG